MCSQWARMHDWKPTRQILLLVCGSGEGPRSGWAQQGLGRPDVSSSHQQFRPKVFRSQGHERAFCPLPSRSGKITFYVFSFGPCPPDVSDAPNPECRGQFAMCFAQELKLPFPLLHGNSAKELRKGSGWHVPSVSASSGWDDDDGAGWPRSAEERALRASRPSNPAARCARPARVPRRSPVGARRAHARMQDPTRVRTKRAVHSMRREPSGWSLALACERLVAPVPVVWSLRARLPLHERRSPPGMARGRLLRRRHALVGTSAASPPPTSM
jgi:hypothetical protein